MRMRRIIVCLAVMCVCLLSAAFAEKTHIHADLQLLTGTKEKSAEADWYSDGAETAFYTTLLPEYRFVGKGSAFASIHADASGLDLKTNDIFRRWKESLPTVEKTGLFSGDAFDAASTVKEMRFTFRDLAFLLLSLEEDPSAAGGLFSAMNTVLIPQDPVSFNPSFLVKEYDQGKYYSLAGEWKESVFMTLSVNLENPSELSCVLGYAENGKNYYWSVAKKKLTENETAFVVEAYADDNQTGFKSLGDSALILSQLWTVRKETDGNQPRYTFFAEIKPANGLTSILLSGEHSRSSDGELLQAEAHFDQKEYPSLSLRVRTDGQEETERAATTVETAKMTAEEKEKIVEELKNQLAGWTNLIYLSLPEEYLLRLIYFQ